MQRISTQGFFPKKKEEGGTYSQKCGTDRDLQVVLPAGMEGIIQEREQRVMRLEGKRGKTVEGPERQAEGSWPPYVDPWFSNGVPWPSSVP